MSSKTTDEQVEELTDLGLSADEAQDLAERYRADGDWGDLEDYKIEDDFKQFERALQGDAGENDDDEDGDEEIVNPQPGVFEIGCDFNGEADIAEYEDESIYVPTGGYCAIKCYNKYYQMKGENPGGNKISYRGLSQFSNSTRAIKKAVTDAKFNWDSAPKMMRHNGHSFVRLSTRNKGGADAAVLLVHLNRNEFHAVLLKPAAVQLRETVNGTVGNYNAVPLAYIREHIRKTINTKLSDDTIKLPPVSIRGTVDTVFVYDIETPCRTSVNAAGKAHRDLIPGGCCYCKVQLKPELKIGPKITFYGIDCIDQMFEHVRVNESSGVIRNAGNRLEERFHFFAHYGGGFDHIYAKQCKNLMITGQIKGQRIKQLTATVMPETKSASDARAVKVIVFQDSHAFTQASLAESAKMFKTSPKGACDIANKDEKWYAENKGLWVPYLEQDVQSLAEVIAAFDTMLRGIGECVGNNTGIPSVAWRIMMKSCHYMSKQFTAKDPTTRRFLRAGLKGGRILHWKQTIENAICLDGNSLYPSAMQVGRYPVGEFAVMPDDASPRHLKEYISKGFLFVAEVTLDAGNVRFPLIPCKTGKGNLIYPAGVFTDVYYSPDIIEALKLGYKIISVKRGLYWVRSAKIFELLIGKLYDLRAAYTKADNPAANMLKILLNSMYGKFLEKINAESVFSKPGDENPAPSVKKRLRAKPKKLPNGQTEFSYGLYRAIERKPTHIGGFILAYSRAIMNDLILTVGPENIAYSDTDSVYVEQEAARGVVESTALCGVKNDYGPGMVVQRALFLDLKRYLLLFNKPDKKGATYKAKFAGLNFKNNGCLRSWHTAEAKFKSEQESKHTCSKQCENLEQLEQTDPRAYAAHLVASALRQKAAIIEMYEEYAKHNIEVARCAALRPPAPHVCDGKCPMYGKTTLQEKWSRHVTGVCIDEKELQFCLDPAKRANWDGDEYYPLGYDRALPERKYDVGEQLSQIDSLKLVHSKHYKLDAWGLESALPLIAPVTTNIPGKEVRKRFKTSFVIAEDGELLKQTYHKIKNIETGELEEVTRYERMTPFGPLEEVGVELECLTHVSITVTASVPAPAEEMRGKRYNKLMLEIKKFLDQSDPLTRREREEQAATAAKEKADAELMAYLLEICEQHAAARN